MKALTVIELAKLYGMNRQSIYKRINKGDLSKNSDGKIDFSEAIRVFGEPSQRSNADVTTLQSSTVQKSAEVDILKQQIDMLQKQLELAQEREVFQREQLQTKDEQIHVMQLLLGAPKENTEPTKKSAFQTIAEEQNSKSEFLAQPVTSQTNENQTQVKLSAIKTSLPQHTQKRGLFGRLVKAILE